MTKISNFLHRMANWKSFLLFLAIYMFFAEYILPNAEHQINELAGKPVGIIDLTVGFNPQQTLNMVAEYGEAARAYYAKTEMTADVAYPIIYAFLLGIILTLLYRNKSYVWVNILPFLTLLLDYLENINIIILLHTFPKQSMTIATLCEVFKLLKWLSVLVIMLMIIAGLVVLLLSKTKRTIK